MQDMRTSVQNTKAKEIATATSTLQEVKGIVTNNGIMSCPNHLQYISYVNLIKSSHKKQQKSRLIAQCFMDHTKSVFDHKS